MDTAKNRTILVLLITVMLLFLINISSCNNWRLKEKNLAKELELRMNLEEKILKLEQDNARLKEVMDKTKQDFDATKKLLADQQLLNDSLKEQLQKTKDVKEALEDNLSKTGAKKR